MKAKIYINYKNGILDQEGTTISKALDSMGINSIKDLSVGKCIEVDLKCKTKNDAVKVIDEACSKLLVNPNTDTYHYDIMED